MGLNRRAKTLIERAAPGREPTADDRARMRARIGERLALAAAATAAASATKAAAGPVAKGGAAIAAPAANASLGVVKLIALSVVGVGLAGGVAFESMKARDRAEPAMSSAPAAVTDPRPASLPIAPARAAEAEPHAAADPVAADAPPSEPAPVETAKPSSAAPPIAPSARAAASSEGPASIDEEIALLRRAQRAISRGENGAAMELLAEHDRRFPNGTLAEERTAARVVALCDLGRADEARAEADAFLRAHPGSTLADRVRSSCAGRKSAP